MSYSQRNRTGMKGSATSGRVTAMTAAMMLLRVSQAKKIERRVFMLTRGVNPKKMPMASPPAMALGVPRMASSLSECSFSQRGRFQCMVQCLVHFDTHPNMAVADPAGRADGTPALPSGRSRRLAVVESHHVLVTHTRTSEDIQRRPDGQVNSSASDAGDLLEVAQRSRAAGVGCRDGGRLRE